MFCHMCRSDLIALADVSAYDSVADVIAMADVITLFIIALYLVADVTATRMMLYPFLFTVRQMLLPHICGRC